MTLLVREVARFLVESVLWLGAATLIASGIALIAARITSLDLRRTIGWCFVGAIALAATADRVNLPTTPSPSVGSRPLPILWLVVGGVASAWILWWTERATGQAGSTASN